MEALFQARAERRDWKGLAGSLALHGLFLLAALWYLAHRVEVPAAVFRVLPVEIVIGGASGAGDTAPAARLQVAPPHRESAPTPQGTNPNGKAQPQDELSAQLRALAHLEAPPSTLPNADNAAAPGGSGGGLGEGNYALKDFIRAQILRRWLPDLGVPGARNMPVLVRLRLSSAGVISGVVILDQERMKGDRAFHDMALSARDAALLASPIQLPPGHYEKSQVLTINLDPKAVLH
jgi:hypothetical protein